MSFGKNKKGEADQASQAISQQGAAVAGASAMTQAEKEQYERSTQIGKLLDEILRYQTGVGGAPSGYLSPEQQYLRQAGPIGQAYYQKTLAGVENPYAAYEDTLAQQVGLIKDMAQREYGLKGFVPSLARTGMAQERFDRASAEAAIMNAQNRMAFRGQELARGGEMGQYSQELGQRNISNLAALYGQQQQVGLQARSTQAQGVAQAAPYYAYPSQAKLGSYYGGVAAQQALPGQLIGAAGTALGGMLGASAKPWYLGGK